MRFLTNLFTIFCLCLSTSIYAQNVSINSSGANPDNSAMLDVQSTTKGILVPRMTKSERDLIPSPATGLMIFQTDNNPGFYFYSGSAWVPSGAEVLRIDDLLDARSDISSIFLGENAGLDDDGSNNNIGIGEDALTANTSGNDNISIGFESMKANTTGNWNVGIGSLALTANQSGNWNTAIGIGANQYNQNGSYNTIIGYHAGRGSALHDKAYNVFLGYNAGYNESGNNKLYIENSDSSTPLIGGDFSLDEVYINGKLGVGTMTPNDNIEVVEDQGTAAVVATTYRSSGFGAGQFIGRGARGTLASPSALQTDDYIASFNARGYGSTAFSDLPRGRMAFRAAENWTDTEQGSYFTLTTTPIGTASNVERLRVNSEGMVGIGITSPITQLEVDGDITFAPAGESSDESRFIGQTIASQNNFDPNNGFGGLEIKNIYKDGTDDSAQELHFWTHNQGVDAARRMTLDIEGKLGIGTDSPNHKLEVQVDDESQQGLYVAQQGNANAGTFDIGNSSSTGHALNVYNNGSGYGLDLVIQSSGTGPGGRFSIDNGANDQPAIYGEHNGMGNVALFNLNNSGSSAPAIEVHNQGSGNAGFFQSHNSSGNYAVIFARHDGLGSAGRFEIQNGSSGAVALYAKTTGTGAALGGNHYGPSGSAGFFNTLNASNIDNTLEIKTQGLGSSAKFQTDNSGNSDPVVLITGNGTGPSLAADGLLSMTGFHLDNSPTEGYVLTTDASGIGTWQVSQDEYGDGGEAGGADRSLGNTDAYALSFLTNDTERLHIAADGNVGIGTTTPNKPLEVNGDTWLEGNLFVGAGTADKLIGFNGTLGDGVIKMYDTGELAMGTDAGVNLRLAAGNTFRIQTYEGSMLDRFYIANDGNIGIGTTTPSGILDIAGNYHFPLGDGSANQVLKTDGSGNLSWSNDNDDVGATMIDELSDGKTGGGSTFLGSAAGLNDDGSSNYNTGVGQGALVGTVAGNYNTALGVSALGNNFSGTKNVGIGHYANYYNSTGSNNTIIGYEAGRGTASHNKSGNVFLGYQAGYYESGSNKLYIANSKDVPPLIYGDFSSNWLTIHGTLDVNEAYHFPTSDGNAGQALLTNGSGSLSWGEVGGDFSDGGEAGGADRSLGNTDAYDLSLETSDVSRMTIYDDGGIKIPGNIGINTEPDASSSINKTLGIFAQDGVFSNAILDLSGVNSSYIQLESRRTGSTNGKDWRISSGSGSDTDLDKFMIYNPDDGECITIRDGGKVGINKHDPDELLHVGGNFRLDGTLEDKDGEAGSSGQFLSSTATGTDWIDAPSGEYSDGGEAGGGARTLGNTDSYALGFLTNGTEQVHIDATGNLGIGTTTPSGILDIAGNYHFPTTDGTANQVLKTDGSGALSWAEDADNGAQEINELTDGKTGGYSVFLGESSGNNDDGSNNYNSGLGYESLHTNTTGNNNTAMGYRALYTNSTGLSNTAVGSEALKSNNGSNNVAIGQIALRDNSSGNANVAIGNSALRINSDGKKNVSIGYESMNFSTTDDENVAVGYHALRGYAGNPAGNANTAIGYQTLTSNSGSYNTAVGHWALQFNSSGTGNVGIGYQANHRNQTGSYNTIIGYQAGGKITDHSKSYNVFLGYQAGYNETGDNKLYIENSNSSSPLLYGEFDNNLLRINGTLDINNVYQFPLTDGTSDQFLKTDGSGSLSWVNGLSDFTDGGEAEGTARTLGNTDNYSLGFLTNNSNRMHITNDGDVGLGTTTPNGQFEVYQNNLGGVTAGDFVVDTDDKTVYVGRLSSTPYNSSDFVVRNRLGYKTFVVSNTNYISLGNYNGSNEQMRVVFDGVNFGVGIGTTTPEAKLHVAGNFRLEGSMEDKDGEAGTNGQILSSTATGTDWIDVPADEFSDGGEAAGTDRTIGNSDSYALGLITNNTTRLHIENDGKIGIGTSTPDSELDVNGVITVQEVTSTPSSPDADGETRVYIKDNKYIIQFNDGGTVKYRYMDLTSTDASWTYTTTAP